MLNLFVYFLLLLVPAVNKTETVKANSAVEIIHSLYAAMNLSEKGLSEEVFQFALKGHFKLENEGKLKNSGILTIADLSQSSKNKRLYVIDLVHKALLFNTYVAHGKNTGDEFARYFSNVTGSYKSSLGFFITREKILGASVGLSLILEGVERGYNDNALKREIIIHGADYATENFIRRTGRLGRSFGCPSLPPDLIKPVVETIKNGTCLFIYSKDTQYISHSALLN